jgi:SAM-dependent methyltransferase
MNETHLKFLASTEWAQMVERELLPWIEAAGDLGDEVLEIGPGPGITTDVLRKRVHRVTAVEIDPALGEALQHRLIGSNVNVLVADARKAGLPADHFSAVACFSVLHHMPSPGYQDELFAEVCRVLRPGGIFVGQDSLDLEPIRLGHADDIFTPVDPEKLGDRLTAVGFGETKTDKLGFHFRFVSPKPR